MKRFSFSFLVSPCQPPTWLHGGPEGPHTVVEVLLGVHQGEGHPRLLQLGGSLRYTS